MATAIFDKDVVANAARQKISQIIDERATFRAAEDKRIEKLVVEEMRRKWYRPWKRSRKHAEEIVMIHCVLPFCYIDTLRRRDYLVALQEATRIVELAERANSDITLSHDDVAFIFSNAAIV